jgi:hypothetical protein
MSVQLTRRLSCCGLLWLLCGCAEVSSCAPMEAHGRATAGLPEPGQVAPFRPH